MINRITLLFTSIILSNILSFSQEYSGTYTEGNNSLRFNDGKVYFKMSEMGSMMTLKVGEGTYSQVGDFMIVEAGEFSGEKSKLELVPASKQDTLVVYVTNENNYAVQGALVELLNSSGKNLQSGVTNGNGKVLFLRHPKVTNIRIFNMGYDDLSFEDNPANDFNIKLAANDIIENKTVIFRFKELDEETLSVLLLSSDAEIGKDIKKTIDRLDKKAIKGNFIDRRMKKEYEQYTPLSTR